ncbi:MAG: hypothetical protein HQL68_02665, partial [Magnetococcales bacterium]|nr:hypothetical protein [Magnetococcales bacterium]
INDGPLDGPINDGPLDGPINDGPLDGPINDGPLDGPINDGPLDGPINNTINDGPINNTINDGPINNTINDGPLDNPINGGPLDNPISTLNDGPINNDPPISVGYTDQQNSYDQPVLSGNYSNIYVNTDGPQPIDLGPTNYNEPVPLGNIYNDEPLPVEPLPGETFLGETFPGEILPGETLPGEPPPTYTPDYTTTTNANAPIVTNVFPPHDGYYLAGDILEVTVHFDRYITLSGGNSYITFYLGSKEISATYSSHTSSSITYSYTVVTGDEDFDGIVAGNFYLNGDTIQGETGVDANMNYNGSPNGAFVIVDAVAPSISSIDLPSAGTYLSGEVLEFTVNFSESIAYTSGTTPSTLDLTLDTGGTVSASLYYYDTDSITYQYTVQDNDYDSDGITVSALTLNSDAIQDFAGNYADTTLPTLSTSSILVGAVYPIAYSYTMPSDGSYAVGDFIEVTVNFDDSVTLTGTSSTMGLHLDTVGDVTAGIFTTSGTTSTTLVYRYTATSALTIASDITVDPITINSDTIQDADGNNAVLGTLNTVTANNQTLSFSAGQDVVYLTDVFHNLNFTPDGNGGNGDFDVSMDIIRFNTTNFGSGWTQPTGHTFLKLLRSSTPSNSITDIVSASGNIVMFKPNYTVGSWATVVASYTYVISSVTYTGTTTFYGLTLASHGTSSVINDYSQATVEFV